MNKKNILSTQEQDELKIKIEQFQNHVPVSDIILTILKAHLVIERTLLEYINERVDDEVYDEIEKQQNGSYYTRVIVARALSCRDEFQSSNNDIVWPALKELGSLRNAIAHNLEHKGSSLEDKIKNFINKVDKDGKMLGLKVTNENLLQTFWYAALALNSYLAIDKEVLTPEYD